MSLKRTFLSLLQLVAIVVLLVPVISHAAISVDDNAFDYAQQLPLGNTAVEATKNKGYLYKFVAPEKGYYTINANTGDSGVQFQYMYFYESKSTASTSDGRTYCDIRFYFEQGECRYLAIGTEEDTTLNIEFRELSGSELVNVTMVPEESSNAKWDAETRTLYLENYSGNEIIIMGNILDDWPDVYIHLTGKNVISYDEEKNNNIRCITASRVTLHFIGDGELQFNGVDDTKKLGASSLGVFSGNVLVDGPTLCIDNKIYFNIEGDFSLLSGKIKAVMHPYTDEGYLRYSEVLYTEYGDIDISGGVIEADYVDGNVEKLPTGIIQSKYGNINVENAVVSINKPSDWGIKDFNIISDLYKSDITISDSALVTEDRNAKKDITQCNISLEQDEYTETGEAVNAKVIIKGLRENEEFTVSYENNIKPGTAKATVTGIGWYEGTATLEYKIIEKPPTVNEPVGDNVQGDGGSQTGGNSGGQGDTDGKNSDTSKGTGNASTAEDTSDKNVLTDVKVGESFKLKNAGYKVTDIHTGSLSVTYVKSTNKKSKSLSVPKTVSYKGHTFKVNAVGAKAFNKFTKLKTVTIGANVKTIGKQAFTGCKNLKTINIKSKVLTGVGKNAFKGIHKKAKIKVPKAKLKVYKKLLKGKGQKKTVKITK